MRHGSSRPVSASGRVIVFLVNGLGDQLLALPAMRALARLFPGRIQLVLGPGMRFMFYQGLEFLAEYRARWADFDARQIDVDSIAERIGPCELFINLTESWQTPSVAELGYRCGARTRVGFFEPCEIRVRVRPDEHLFDRHFEVPAALDPSCSIDSFDGPPVFSSAAREAAARHVRRHVAPGERLLFVHPETAADRQWSAEGFGHCLADFLGRRPEYRAYICSRDPWPLPDLGDVADRVVRLDAHLELSMAILGLSDAFLGVNSCFLHCADLYRIPGVALFGPTKPELLGFRFSNPGYHLQRWPTRDIPVTDVTEALHEVAGAVGRTSAPRGSAHEP